MSKSDGKTQITDVAGQVHAQFLASLKAEGVSEAVIARLALVLNSGTKPTKKALADALFVEDKLP
jgi:hypothetical protein